MLNRLDFARDVDALFSHVLECWDTARAGRPMPRRTDINPVRLGPALAYVSLIDVVQGEPLDFQYRLVGQHIITHSGQNIKGKRNSELPPASPSGRPINASYLTCVESRSIVQRDETITNMNGTRRRMQWQLLPLSEDGETVNAILGAALYHD